jgi:hypothetical protein
MTLRVFYRKLRELRDKYSWKLYYDWIRCPNRYGVNSYFCPITAVNLEETHQWRHMQDAHSLGLVEDIDNQLIVHAADGHIPKDCDVATKRRIKAIRRAILNNLGLKERH